MKKVTIKDIARKVGCAPSMVSMAMNDKRGISKALKERILKVANDMNWSPSLASSTLRKGQSNKILMMLPFDGLSGDVMANNGVIALLDGLIKYLQNTSFDIDIAFEIEKPETLYPKINRERQPAAFIFMNILRNDWRHNWLKEMNIPFVSFGQLAQDKSYNFVDLDSFQYAYDATYRAIQLGFNDVILFSSHLKYTYAGELENGFQQAFTNKGLTYKEQNIIKAESLEQMQNPRKLIDKLLKENVRGKAFISPSDNISIHLIKALYDQGYDIQKDVYIASLSSSHVLDMLAPSVDIWHQDTFLAGQKIAQIITFYLSQDNPRFQHEIFKAQLLAKEALKRRAM